MKRKLLSGLLASAVLFLAACGDGGVSEKTTAAADLPDAGDFGETVDLQLSGMVTKGNVVDDNWVQQRLEEKFNVNIENTLIDTWDANERAIAIASGELPDAFSFTGEKMTPQEFNKNGLTRTIPRDMIEKYAPKYAAMLDEVDDGLGWQMHQSPDNPDEYYALVGLQSHAQGILWAPTLRMDWMEKLGIEIPADATPIGEEGGAERIYMSNHSYTVEELEKILQAFTYDDPDGNGKNDTYGMLPTNDNMNWAVTLLGAYGLPIEYNLMEDDQLKMPVISEHYKDFLGDMNRWYEEGLIDPEWTTLTTQTAWEKYQTGKIGYQVAQRSYLAQEAWTKGRAPVNIIDSDPNAKLLVLQPETGKDGQQGEQSFMPVTLLGDWMQISADVTDEELARYLQMYDFINHDEEGVWTTYGIPGEHSEWRGEEGNSTLIVKEEYDREEGEMGFWAYSARSYPGKRFNWLTETKTIELMDKFFNVPEVVEEMAIRPYRHDLFNETDLIAVQGRYSAQLKTLEDEFKLNGITGSVDIESEWDTYVDNWLNNGGQQILDEYEKAPLVSDLLPE